MMDFEIVYCSHNDFQRVMQYSLYREIDGDFTEHIKLFNEQIAEAKEYGDAYRAHQLIVEKAQYIQKWAWPSSCISKIVVDLDTGEVMLPNSTNL